MAFAMSSMSIRRGAVAAISARPAVAVGLRAARPSGMVTAGLAGIRFNSTTPTPATRAQQVLDALPGSSLLSKTSVLTLGTAVSAYAISKELYVINDDSIMLLAFVGICTLLFNQGGSIYREWAESQINRMKDVLNGARAEHTQAVKDRIASVAQMKDVVDTTKTLFAISKETAQMEAKAFELQQQLDIQQEARTVLDSWLRYEANKRQAEQSGLASSVISNVESQLRTDKKLQQRILEAALADAEKIISQAK